MSGVRAAEGVQCIVELTLLGRREVLQRSGCAAPCDKEVDDLAHRLHDVGDGAWSTAEIGEC